MGYAPAVRPRGTRAAPRPGTRTLAIGKRGGGRYGQKQKKVAHMMMTNNRKPRWFFYPAWVALSTISIPITAGIALALVSLATKVVGDTIQVGGLTHITEDYLLGD